MAGGTEASKHVGTDSAQLAQALTEITIDGCRYQGTSIPPWQTELWLTGTSGDTLLTWHEDASMCGTGQGWYRARIRNTQDTIDYLCPASCDIVKSTMATVEYRGNCKPEPTQ